MGAVKLDIHRTDRAATARYTHTDASGETEYTAPGIARLLGDIYRMSAGAEYKGDISAIILRLDLEAALKSRCLTPRQRQVVALRYFAELTQSETAAVLGVAQPTVKEYIDAALDNIAKEMNEGGVEVAQLRMVDAPALNDDMGDVSATYAWISAVYRGEAEWWRVPDAVIAELNRRFPVKEPRKKFAGDDESGAPYPILSDDEYRYRARDREVSCAHVFMADRFAGRRKSGERERKDWLRITG